jgi:hypothetical protein
MLGQSFAVHPAQAMLSKLRIVVRIRVMMAVIIKRTVFWASRILGGDFL